MDLRARIAALTAPAVKKIETTDEKTTHVRERLQRLGLAGTREDAPRAEDADIGADLLTAWREEVDRAAAEPVEAPSPRRKRSPSLETIEGATVIGQGEVRYLRIDRPLDDSVRDGTLHWLLNWEGRHAQVLSPDARLQTIDPTRALFIDTETTGLGGASSLVFLIGCVYWQDGRPHLTQFFLFGPPGETRMMADWLDFLARFDFLVSYNGRAFDVRALCDRLIISGLKHGPHQLEALPHVDLLHPARRIWRHALKDCRLVTLEAQVLGRPRGDDVDGMYIPMIYYNYLRHGRTRDIHKVIRHNALDTISLALLASTMMRMLTDPAAHALHEGTIDEKRRVAEQHVGLGDLLAARGHVESAEATTRLGLQDVSPLNRYLARKRLASLHKKRGDVERALPLWHAMMDENVLGEVHPYTEVAKYHEHCRRDFMSALAIVNRCLEGGVHHIHAASSPEIEALRRRQQRLRRRLFLPHDNGSAWQESWDGLK